jgi:LCP family protein required for cell wall assembly
MALTVPPPPNRARPEIGATPRYDGDTVNSVGAAIRAFSLRIGLAILLCALIVAGSVVVVNRYIDNKVDTIPRVALTTAPVGANGMNFLIIGSDSRSFVDNAIDYNAFSDKNTQNAPPRSDTMMVLHANGDNSYAVSFPRDLWVNIPGKGDAKINAAFNDGPQKVVDTLQADFNLKINHYLEVDFVTFEGIVNAIGAVPVWIPGVVRDDFTGFYSPFGAGCYPLNGAASLQYVRARNLQILNSKGQWVPLDATADIGRIKRQQDFVKKLGRIAVERTLDDPLIAPDIVDALMPNLHADDSFNRSALNELVRAFMGLASGGAGLDFETFPWYDPGKPVGGQSVVLVKQPEADAVLARLRGDVVVAPEPTTTAAPVAPVAVRPVDVRVRVLNGSGIDGAAGKAEQALSNLGFVSGGVGNNASGAVSQTEIRYHSSDEAKAQLLARSVPEAKLVTDPTLVGGDVVLVLGAGFKGVGATAAKDTATPTPTTTPLSAEEACNQS